MARAAKHSKAVVEEPAVVPPATPVALEPVVAESAPVVVDAVEPVAAKPGVSQPAVSQEDIAKLAYSYWVARGYQGGNPHEDWVRAEQELLAV